MGVIIASASQSTETGNVQYVQKEIERGKKIEVVEFEEFLKMLGTTEEELNALPTKNYEYLLMDLKL